MAKMTKRTGMMNKDFLVKQLIMIISFHLVIYVFWDVPKSWLLAIISPGEKEPTTGSICKGKQRSGVILKVQLSKKAGLTNKKACLAFL